MSAIKSLHFDTDALPPGRRFAAWTAAMPHCELSLLSEDARDSFRCVATSWYLGDVILTRAGLSAVRWNRTPQRIAADGIDTYNFLLMTRGQWVGRAGDRDFTIGAGQLGCFDLAQPYAGESTQSDSFAITFARPTLGRRLRAEPDLHGRIVSGPAGALLVDYLLALERQLPSLTQDDVPAMTRTILTHFAATIEMATRDTPFSSNVEGLRHNARLYIEQHLADPDFTVARVARDLDVPRSTLYRSFAALGGVAAYIQRRRLEAIRLLLADANEKRSVGELAQTFGFASPSHLATAFRRAYGVTPRQHRQTARGLAAVGSETLDPTDTYQMWTGTLQGRSL